MKIRRFLILLACLALLYLTTMCSASAELSNGFYYRSEGEGEIFIYDTTLKGDIVVPETLDGCTVTGVAISDNSDITSIVLPDTVRSILSCGFENCSMKRIVLPKNLEMIGSEAFRYCRNLEEIVIPDSVISIGARAFDTCEALKRAKLPGNLQEINEYLFYGCSSLEEIVIPDSVTSVGNNVFQRCGALKRAKLSDGITVINERLFSECTSLEEIVIPEGVTTLSYAAFFGCTGLKSVVLPGSLTSKLSGAGNSVFYACDNLESVSFSGENTLYTIVDNVVYSKDMKALLWGPCGMTGELRIPDGVETIAPYALYKCTGLDGVLTIGDSVTSIGKYAFYSCSGLTGLELGSGLSEIGNYVFYKCSGLRGKLVIPDSIRFLGEYAFAQCGGLYELSLGRGLEEIGPDAFYHCTGLSGELVIPEGTKKIGTSAFSGCYNLLHITVPDSVTSIGSAAFSNCIRLTGIELGKGISTIPSGMLSYCRSLKNLTIPDSVTTVESMCLESSYNLERILIPDSVTSIKGLMRTHNNYTVYCSEGSAADLWAQEESLKIAYLNGDDPESFAQLSLGRDMKLNIGQSCALPVGVFPETIRDAIVYKSSAPEVISVDSSGVATAHRQGTAVITASVGSQNQTMQVTGVIPVEDFDILPARTDYYSGEEVQFSLKFYPEGADGDVLWFTTDTSHLVVGTYDGYAYFSGEGEASICAIVNGINKSEKAGVYSPPEYIRFEAEMLNLRPGETTMLQALALTCTDPYYNRFMTFESSDPSVATVGPDGSLTAISPGTAVIIASFEKISAQCTVKVYSKSLELPADLEVIAAEAFAGADVDTVVLNGNVRSIGTRAFADNAQLRTVCVPDSVTEIADDAFEGCENVSFRCTIDSFAAEYARAHGIPFAVVP